MQRLFTLILTLISAGLLAQAPGDTIKVRTFHYGSNNRDTTAYFPTGNFTFEKIIMKYSMRCKNGLVSTGTDRNLGCGEWDYSCNTYIVDSSRVEEVANTQASYVVANFNGSSFPYKYNAVYDYYRYTQKKVIHTPTNADTAYAVLAGTMSAVGFLNPARHSAKAQFVILNSELSNAGLTAGAIQTMSLFVDSFPSHLGFLRIKIKHTLRNHVLNGIPDTGSFTEVFYQDIDLVKGENKIYFHTPFAWNGTDNILVEVSTTNSTPGNTVFWSMKLDATPMMLQTADGNAIDLSNNAHVLLDSSGFSGIKNEMSISFWTFGTAIQLPPSNSILYGVDNNINNRQLNIHLPHSSNNIYFDCGFAAGGYDRISQLSKPEEQVGRWNHWTFTKNAVSGEMKIFLNGKLWLSGTGKTKAMTYLKMILGKDINLANNYKGKVADLRIWNIALPDSVIPQAMMVSSYSAIPFYNNLISSYTMIEGADTLITNDMTGKRAGNANLRWTWERGDKLFRGFLITELRPKVTFGRGNYTLQVSNQTVTDSVARNKSVVAAYSIVSKAGVTPLTNDIVKTDTVYQELYSALPARIYNGDADTLQLIDSVVIVPDGVFNVQNLTWYRRFPWYNEIMSFVTPYGINLDLGMQGKSWYYDVSDFAPLLKNNKRIVMTLGGQNQEQNDIEFWFIVGTPPRPVLEFNQLWQGTNRTGSASLASINNNTRFAAVNVPILSNARGFKIRSSITGHGNEGEFESNGGPVMHMINLNGGDTDYVWSLYQRCAFNPIFPQGGTWVYDRQGWCPGQSSLLKETDITNKVTPGTNLLVDYLASTQPKAGAYNYQVAHQLVSYGNFSFTRDARIYEVMQPSDKILYGRSNPICAQPKIIVQNTGSQTITEMVIQYWVNNKSNARSFTYKRTMAPMQKDTVALPINDVYNGSMTASGNVFYASIESVNGSADEYALNNTFATTFAKPQIIPSVFTLEIYTNNNPTENSFRLEDADGNLVDSKSFTAPNTLFSKQYNLGGCYKIIVEDLGEDGLQWWANSAQGTGYARIKDGSGKVIKTFQPDFGARFEFSFTTNWALKTEELSLNQKINLYPNPTREHFMLEGDELVGATVYLTDIAGHTLPLSPEYMGNKVSVSGLSLSSGVYFVVIEKGGEKAVKELLIQ